MKTLSASLILAIALLASNSLFAQCKTCPGASQSVAPKVVPITPKAEGTYTRAPKVKSAPQEIANDNSKEGRIRQLEYYRDQYTDAGTRAKYQAQIDALKASTK